MGNLAVAHERGGASQPRTSLLLMPLAQSSRNTNRKPQGNQSSINIIKTRRNVKIGTGQWLRVSRGGVPTKSSQMVTSLVEFSSDPATHLLREDELQPLSGPPHPISGPNLYTWEATDMSLILRGRGTALTSKAQSCAGQSAVFSMTSSK